MRHPAGHGKFLPSGHNGRAKDPHGLAKENIAAECSFHITLGSSLPVTNM
jgi:hypothetical protein